MRLALLAALPLTLLARSEAAPGDPGASGFACPVPLVTGTAFTLTCSAAQLTLTLTGSKTETGDAALRGLTLRPTGGTQQHFVLDGQIAFDSLRTAPALVDINFDGQKDLKLATTASAGPNMGYDYWLYDAKTKAFTATTLGEQLSGYEITPDAKTKTIAVLGRSSCCSWNRSTYGWAAGKLVLRAATDSLSFDSLPGLESGPFCGTKTISFTPAGLMTAISVTLDSEKDFDPNGDAVCDRAALKAQGQILSTMRAKAGGYRIEAKDAYHFTLIFTPPRKAD